MAELRKLAEHSDFGAVLSDMLRDRLVCGIRQKSTQRRLLCESDLTYDKALETAQAAESADKDAQRLSGAAPNSNFSGALVPPPPPQTQLFKVSGPRSRFRNNPAGEGRTLSVDKSGFCSLSC